MAKKESTTQPLKEEATRPQEGSSTLTPSPSEGSEEKQPGKPTKLTVPPSGETAGQKLTVPHSVQFLTSTTVNNNPLNQVSRSQQLIEPGYFLGAPGVWLRPHDPRSKLRTFVPISAWKAMTLEEVDTTEPVQSEGSDK